MNDRRLVAGVGFRRGVPSDAIVALLRRALAEAAPDGRLAAIATATDRAGEPAIRDAAAAFGLVPTAVEPDALERADTRVRTRSARIEALRGVGSLAEAAALAVVGEAGYLIRTRIDDGRATCALAVVDIAATTGTASPAEAEGTRSEVGRSPNPRPEHAGTAQIVTAIA